jgi:hypothetical protein
MFPVGYEQAYRPPRPVTGIALLFLLTFLPGSIVVKALCYKPEGH